MTPAQTQGWTAELVKGISDVTNAQLRFNALYNEIFVRQERKRSLKRWVNNLNSIVNEFRRECPAESKILDEQVLDPNVTLQLEGIMSKLVYLPHSSRDLIEKQIDKFFNQLKEKKKEAKNEN